MDVSCFVFYDNHIGRFAYRYINALNDKSTYNSWIRLNVHHDSPTQVFHLLESHDSRKAFYEGSHTTQPGGFLLIESSTERNKKRDHVG